MVKHQTILIALAGIAILVLGLLSISPGTVRADDPTPTVTPYPMPTRQFSNLRPTPTPWAITPSANGFDIHGDDKAGELADTIINAYGFINFGKSDTSAGVIDFVLFFVTGFMVIRALMALITGTSEDD